MPRKSNLDEFNDEIVKSKSPIIAFDIGTTGMMNGNDNRITQIALASYEYNKNTNSYELQDKIFMLAKPDKAQLQTILDNEQPTPENIAKKAYSEYLYKIRSSIKNCNNRIDTFNRKIEKGTIPADLKSYNKSNNVNLTAEEYYKTIFKNTNGNTLSDELAYLERLNEFLQLYETKDMNKNLYKYWNYKDIYEKENLVAFIDYKQSRTDEIKQEMIDAVKMEEYMAKEGIDLAEYMNSDKGLTDAELQTGITEFLSKYKKDNTVFLTTNGYTTRHYLEKQGLLISNKEDTTIDWANVVKSKATIEREIFSVNNGEISSSEALYSKIKPEKVMELADFIYLHNETNVNSQIETVDALTKCLCLAQLTMYASDINFSNTSKEYLENMVKEKAMSQDEGYVMSLTRASTLHWIPASMSSYDIADYHFNSLEYVNFGNDRRYIDIDKMFEVNNNFEITLEGTKEPIKTWEELEAKIKALNSEISPQLLEKIHQKYEEIHKEVIAKTEKLDIPLQKTDYEPSDSYSYHSNSDYEEETHYYERDAEYDEDEYDEYDEEDDPHLILKEGENGKLKLEMPENALGVPPIVKVVNAEKQEKSPLERMKEMMEEFKQKQMLLEQIKRQKTTDRAVKLEDKFIKLIPAINTLWEMNKMQEEGKLNKITIKEYLNKEDDSKFTLDICSYEDNPNLKDLDFTVDIQRATGNILGCTFSMTVNEKNIVVYKDDPIVTSNLSNYELKEVYNAVNKTLPIVIQDKQNTILNELVDKLATIDKELEQEKDELDFEM